jgi:hypothetical protein
MSFSAFTLGEGVCSASSNPFELPTCPLLTFDLALLHLLSTSTLALLLVILSTALSPGYAASLSNIDGKPREGEEGGLVMWEMAVNSPPQSPRLGPAVLNLGAGSGSGSGYGAIESDIPRPTPSVSKTDRYAKGGVVVHALLLLVSISVFICAIILMTKGEFGIYPTSQYDQREAD